MSAPWFPVKRRYWIVLLLLFILFVLAPVLVQLLAVAASSLGPEVAKAESAKEEPPYIRILDTAFQSLGIFAALATAVLAVAVADPPDRKTKIDVQGPWITEDSKAEYKRDEIPDSVIGAFSNYPKPSFFSYRVYLKLINRSSFNLKKCAITVNAPNDRKHPCLPPPGDCTPHMNNDLQQQGPVLWKYETDDRWGITCARVVDWHSNDALEFYLRMVLDNGSREAFSVNVCVMCENAEGFAQKVTVEPDRLLPAKEEGTKLEI